MPSLPYPRRKRKSKKLALGALNTERSFLAAHIGLLLKPNDLFQC